MNWSPTLMAYLARRFSISVLIVFAALVVLALSIDLADLFTRTGDRGIAADVIVSMSLLKLPDIAQKLLPFAVSIGSAGRFLLNKYFRKNISPRLLNATEAIRMENHVRFLTKRK